MKKKQTSYLFFSFSMIFIILFWGCQNQSENNLEQIESMKTLSTENSSVTTVKHTREQVLDARKKFKVEVISFDASQEFGTEFPYSDYVKLRITNNSNIVLPYLTVLTKRFDKSGKMIGSSRFPNIQVNNIKPNESFEYDYYPRGHLPNVKEIKVEIEHIISDEEMQFFKELQWNNPKFCWTIIKLILNERSTMPKLKMPNKFEIFYSDLLCELAKVGSINTMTKNKENIIRVENRNIFVATEKSSPKFEEIPLKFIMTTYEELLNNNEVSQSYLSETLYVKRSAFIMSAFALLKDYIVYDKNSNSLKVINK